MWRPFSHTGQLCHGAFGLQSKEGMSSDAQELTSVELIVKASLEHFHDKAVLVEPSSMVTLAYINHSRSCFLFLSSVTWHFWSMCHQVHIHLLANHGLGKVNVQAHWISQWKRNHTNIHLELEVFEKHRHNFIGPALLVTLP